MKLQLSNPFSYWFKRLAILLTLFIAYTIKATGQDWVTYTVYQNKFYPDPAIGGSVGDRLSFDFTLGEGWQKIQLNPSHDTQKILGVSELFGSNSLRLGVRRSANPKDTGLVAVAYAHVGGATVYPAIKDKFDRPVILHYYQQYHCEIYRSGAYWLIDISSGGVPIGSYSTLVTISSMFRRLSGIYIELASKPSPYTIITNLRITKR